MANITAAELARRAACDRRTARRWLDGEIVRPLADQRCKRAAKEILEERAARAARSVLGRSQLDEVLSDVGEILGVSR